MAKFKKGDIIIEDDWQIILILYKNKTMYDIQILKILHNANQNYGYIAYNIEHVDRWYRLITNLEKIKYL